MGGAAGSDGYLYQTMIAVMGSLDDKEWKTVSIEPAGASEKVDITFNYGNRSRVVQVKHSRNQIAVPQAKRWAEELLADQSATEHELILLGPCSKGISKLPNHKGVTIPTPFEVNTQSLLEQGAHKLTIFLEKRGKSITPTIAELIVKMLIGDFFCNVTKDITREDLEEKLEVFIKRQTHNQAKQVISRMSFPHHAAEYFKGRETELSMLDSAWEQDPNINLVSIIAWGGVGKTALLIHWINSRFVSKNWRNVSDEPNPVRYFDWSFYNQSEVTNINITSMQTRSGSAGDFFEQALAFFNDPDPSRAGKGARLALYVKEQKNLLVLDGLEPLQYPPNHPYAGRIIDNDMRDLLTSIAQQNTGLCIVTSRETLTDLSALKPAVNEVNLENLSTTVAADLLEIWLSGDVTDPYSNDRTEIELACEELERHALSISLLGSYIADAHGGNISRRDTIQLEKADRLTRPQRNRSVWPILHSYEKWLQTSPDLLAILKLMGLFDKPAPLDCIHALRTASPIEGLTDSLLGIKDDEWNVLLKRLEKNRLVKIYKTDESEFLDVHPLIAEYFASQMRKNTPVAFQTGHSVLFDHLTTSTTPHRPETLISLQPLFQAVKHGCLAKRFEGAFNVYIDRIQRGTGEIEGFYSTKRLGSSSNDLSALSNFFEEPWAKITNGLRQNQEATVLSETATRLQFLGRVNEAKLPMNRALENNIILGHWKQIAQGQSVLSNLQLLLGDIESAITLGNESVSSIRKIPLSERSLYEWAFRTDAANALHQQGKIDKAKKLFRTAEKIQRKFDPSLPILYGPPGANFRELLLAEAEVLVWQEINARSAKNDSFNSILSKKTKRSSHACAIVLEQTEQALKSSTRHEYSYYAAIDQRIGCVATIYQSILKKTLWTDRDKLTDLSSKLKNVLYAMRNAGRMDSLPKALLTSAMFVSIMERSNVTNLPVADWHSVKYYLDEAQSIAERGPMPLYLADVHLNRARIFHDRKSLAKAEKLITKHNYLRRQGELEDAVSIF